MRSGVILLVDDNDVLLRTMQAALRMSGIESHAVHSGEEALEWLKSGGEAAGVIADHWMNGMSGLELLTQLQALVPGAFRVLHTGQSSVEVSVPPGSALTVVAKPTPVALLRRLAMAALQEPVRRG
jgi:DNA-binding NtrC family response regulator